MGLLKDIQEKNHNHAVDELEGCPDLWDDPDYMEYQLVQAQKAWEERLAQMKQELLENYLLAQQAVLEISERDSAKRLRGPKPSLNSYKGYKRRFLSAWAVFVAKSAKKKDGLNQDDLAALLGFGSPRQWRVMKSGAEGNGGGHYRATTMKFNNNMVEEIARKKGWHRRGQFQLLWPLEHLMGPNEFEEWAIAVNRISYEQYLQNTKKAESFSTSREEFEEHISLGFRRIGISATMVPH